jgi:adenine deaminase
VVSGADATILPLGCAGLMSIRPYEEVCDSLRSLNQHVEAIGGKEDSFMYLSFLSLSVIPSLRITERGLFDVDRFTDVPVFSDEMH